jgi:hypothetical protein
MNQIAHTCPAQVKETPQEQEVALAAVRYTLKKQQWILPATLPPQGIDSWREVTGEEIPNNSLKMKISMLTDDGLLLFVRAKRLPEQLRLQLPSGEFAAVPEVACPIRASRSHYVPSLKLLERFEAMPTGLAEEERQLIPWAKGEVNRIIGIVNEPDVPGKPSVRDQLCATNIKAADPLRRVIDNTVARLRQNLPCLPSVTDDERARAVRDAMRSLRLPVAHTDGQTDLVFETSKRMLEARLKLDARDGYGDREKRR